MMLKPVCQSLFGYSYFLILSLHQNALYMYNSSMKSTKQEIQELKYLLNPLVQRSSNHSIPSGMIELLYSSKIKNPVTSALPYCRDVTDFVSLIYSLQVVFCNRFEQSYL